MKNLFKTSIVSLLLILAINANPQVYTCPFTFEGGNCGEIWTLYIAGATWGSLDMVAGDQIAIFDGEIMVGLIELTQVCTPDNLFENAFPAFTELPLGLGYTPGNPFTFKACIDNDLILSETYVYTMSDPYGGAWTGDVFPPGDGQYSIIQLNFECTFIEIDQSCFGQTLSVNGSVQDFLNISGPGCDTLIWNIEIDFLEKDFCAQSSESKDIWLSVDPLDGILAPEESELVTLDFNANNLEEGIYYAIIILLSNDLSNPEVIIPVIMIVGLPLQHFTFEGGNPDYPIWTINLASGNFDNLDLQPLDEIAIFDGDVIVGAFLLDEILAIENSSENSLIAYSTLNSQPGYQPGNQYRFKCWDAINDVETDYYDINLLDPYGDAYTGDVFPAGENDYSIAEINFLTTIVQSYNLSEGYQFISSNLELMDSDMTVVLTDILNYNLDFVRNSAGLMLRKIGNTWVNGIGDWVIEEAYLVKMFINDSFTIDGIFIDPETPISLTTGYQLVSFLPVSPVNALHAFQSIIGDNLDFIRNSQGYTLQKIGSNWINNMGICYPKDGYLIKMNSDDTLIFTIIHACGEQYIDIRDLQIYNTIEIGDQCWMAENLNIGSMVDGNINQTNNSVIEKYCYDNDPVNCEIYGGLYQWNEMMQYVAISSTQGICQDGWHLPSDAEWYDLENYLDPSINNPNSTGWRGTDCGIQMLEGGSSGFEGLLSGYKDWNSAEFLMMGERTYFSSTSRFSVNYYSWYRLLENDNPQVYRNNAIKHYGFSVRCLRNEIISQVSGQTSNFSVEETIKNDNLNKNIFIRPGQFVVKDGNPQDPVWTIYFEKGSLNIGDEIGIYEGDLLTGAAIVNSENIFENAIPIFSNLYKTGNLPIIKVWDKTENKEYFLTDYTFLNPYGDAWTENAFPAEDGEYSLLHFSTTGISDENEKNSISIYPNPTTGIITIGNLNLSGLDLEITDITGKIVFQSTIINNKSSIEIDLSQLEKGVYFVNINGKNFYQLKKIVIQ